MDHPRHRHIDIAAEDSDGTGEDQARLCSHSQGVKQGARAVQVGAQAEIEIGFAFRGNRGGEMKDDIESLMPQGRALVDQCAWPRANAGIGSQVRCGWEQISQDQLLYAVAGEMSTLQQSTR